VTAYLITCQDGVPVPETLADGNQTFACPVGTAAYQEQAPSLFQMGLDDGAMFTGLIAALWAIAFVVVVIKSMMRGRGGAEA
jgi:hypothetical protein